MNQPFHAGPVAIACVAAVALLAFTFDGCDRSMYAPAVRSAAGTGSGGDGQDGEEPPVPDWAGTGPEVRRSGEIGVRYAGSFRKRVVTPTGAEGSVLHRDYLVVHIEVTNRSGAKELKHQTWQLPSERRLPVLSDSAGGSYELVTDPEPFEAAAGFRPHWVEQILPPGCSLTYPLVFRPGGGSPHPEYMELRLPLAGDAAFRLRFHAPPPLPPAAS